MAGYPPTSPPAVLVAPTFKWNMPYRAPRMAFQPFATVKSEANLKTEVYVLPLVLA